MNKEWERFPIPDSSSENSFKMFKTVSKFLISQKKHLKHNLKIHTD